MYDMSGFDYDIRDVVRILNLRIRRKNSRSYDVDCPFCGYKTGKMNVNIEKNVFRCNYCDEQGGMLDLYGKLYNLSKSEANRQIREALNLGQYRDNYEKPVAVEEPPMVENSELAALEEIDHTYQVMLSQLSLSKKHLEDLEGRGLTREQIEAQRYRSVPLFGMKNLVRLLIEKGCTVKGVPGFYLDEDGEWSLNFSARLSGILIPIISAKGLIQGFQIRLDHVIKDCKYIWFSSVNKNLGVSSGSPVHVIGNLDVDTVYITEGALKGTIAHYLSRKTFICVAGVNLYANLQSVLEDFQQRNLKFVYEAYDMDKKMKTDCDQNYKKCQECKKTDDSKECPYKVKKRKNIRNGCQKMYEVCRNLALPVQRMLWDTDETGHWNGEIKGIDDLYYEMKKQYDHQKTMKPE